MADEIRQIGTQVGFRKRAISSKMLIEISQDLSRYASSAT